MTIFRKFKAAAVQAAPCFLDVNATLAKSYQFIQEAASNGAKLVAFPEVFIPAYPYWNWIYTPLRGSAWFKKLALAAIEVPGPEVDQLCEWAKAYDIHIAMGINERDEKSAGAIYNTNLLISPSKGIVNHRRKMVQTFAEKLTWSSGDADGLCAVETELGRIGMLACGENTNTLARFALLADGEQVHIANFIAFPFNTTYSMAEAIRIRTAAHAFEGKVFSIVSCSALTPEIIDLLATTPEERELMSGTPTGFTGIINPHGQVISNPIEGDEGIAYAEIDLSAGIEPKQFADIIGDYNRFDIFRLTVDRSARPRINWSEGIGADTGAQSATFNRAARIEPQ
jgi:predicted amidohydrolase